MAKNSKPKPNHDGLPPEKLRWRCDPARIPFETTADIEPASNDLGQDRALRALRMGVELTASGYNLFVCGLSGTSRGGMIVRMIEEMHPQTEPAPDRCYVNNFKNSDRPRLLTLPRGQANAFRKEVESGIDFLRRRIPQVFEGEPFQRQKTRIVERFTLREKELMDDFTRRIARDQFALGRMQVGAVALPEIFPVLDGQMVPIEEIPKMVHGRKARKRRRRGTRTQIRSVPPGIHRRLPEDALALARTRERNELPRAGSCVRAGRRRDRRAQGKISQHANFRISRRSPPPHSRQSRSVQGTRRRGRTAAVRGRRRPAPGTLRSRSLPRLRRECDSRARRAGKVPRDFRDDSHLRERFRHGPSQLRHARRMELRFHGFARRLAPARRRRLPRDVRARHADGNRRLAHAEAHAQSRQARNSARRHVFSRSALPRSSPSRSTST